MKEKEEGDAKGGGAGDEAEERQGRNLTLEALCPGVVYTLDWTQRHLRRRHTRSVAGHLLSPLSRKFATTTERAIRMLAGGSWAQTSHCAAPHRRMVEAAIAIMSDDHHLVAPQAMQTKRRPH